MNRRIPNGTYGGVRGRGRRLPLLLDAALRRFGDSVVRAGVFQSQNASVTEPN